MEQKLLTKTRAKERSTNMKTRKTCSSSAKSELRRKISTTERSPFIRTHAVTNLNFCKVASFWYQLKQNIARWFRLSRRSLKLGSGQLSRKTVGTSCTAISKRIAELCIYS
jgi:hypothetical protein